MQTNITNYIEDRIQRHRAISLVNILISHVTKLVSVGLGPPRKLLDPLEDQTDRHLPSTDGVGVALAYGAYVTV